MRTNYLHSYCLNFEFRTEYYGSKPTEGKANKKKPLIMKLNKMNQNKA